LFVIGGIVISYLSAQHFEARRLFSAAVTRLRDLGRVLEERSDRARALRTICGDAIWELKLGTNAQIAAAAGGPDQDPTDAMEFTTWLKQIHPKDRLNAMTSLRSALEQGRTEWSYEYRRLRPGRGYVHVSDHAYIMRDDEWNPIRVVARSADQAELRGGSSVPQTEGPYRAFFENNPEAVLLADRGLRIAEANEAACDLLGYRRPDLRRLNVENVFEQRKRGLVMDKLVGLNMNDHSSTVFEVDCLRADGEVFRAKISAAVISQIEGSLVDRMITIEEIADPEPSR
jgi:PAS domain S-box-containing protein